MFVSKFIFDVIGERADGARIPGWILIFRYFFQVFYIDDLVRISFHFFL